MRFMNIKQVTISASWSDVTGFVGEATLDLALEGGQVEQEAQDTIPTVNFPRTGGGVGVGWEEHTEMVFTNHSCKWSTL